MTLSQRVADLASRIGAELKQRIDADHPGVAKAWVNFGWTNRIEMGAAYNVALVLRLSEGRYRIVFKTPFADTHYCWLAFARNAGSARSLKFAAARAQAEAKTTAYIEVACMTANGAFSDTTELNLVIFR